MCAIIEALFLIAGIWLLIAGKIPNKFFSLLFGKGKYDLPPYKARLWGLLLAIPLPLVILVSFLLGLFMGKDALTIAAIFEYALDIAVFISAIIIARKIRQPDATANSNLSTS